MDKRKLSRIDFYVEAVFSYQGLEHKARVKNLSLKGALIETNEKLDIGINEKLDIVLSVKGLSSTLEIHAKGIVVRKEEASFGLKLENMDLDSFIHLRNIIAYNSGDYDKIMEEFINNSF